MAKAASSSSSSCISFIEEFLILPARNVRLFASTFLLTFVHTFVFLAVAILRVHPLATDVLLRVDVLKTAHPSSHEHAKATHEIQGHANKLLVLYLAYLASKLATQVATVLASSATCSGSDDERPGSFCELIRCKAVKVRVLGPVVTAALVAVLELASTALMVACLAAWWRYMDAEYSCAAFLFGCLLSLLALLFYLYLGAVFAVSIAASAVEEEGYGGVRAVWRAWSVMHRTRKEAAVQLLMAGLLPVAFCPVYVFAFDFSKDLHIWRSDGLVWLLVVLYGYVLPSVGVQFYSIVAATVFYYRYHEPAAKVSSDEAAENV